MFQRLDRKEQTATHSHYRSPLKISSSECPDGLQNTPEFQSPLSENSSDGALFSTTKNDWTSCFIFWHLLLRYKSVIKHPSTSSYSTDQSSSAQSKSHKTKNRLTNHKNHITSRTEHTRRKPNGNHVKQQQQQSCNIRLHRNHRIGRVFFFIIVIIRTKRLWQEAITSSSASISSIFDGSTKNDC